ncbi:MAG: DNA-3-methyladenine glycosylase I [Acidimicrobiia bacterium]
MSEVERCSWCLGDPLYTEYHDLEWGVPEKDGRRLFAKLILDGAQAGLSWLTILRKRDGYYRAFDGFDPQRVAAYDEPKVTALLSDPGIVRNRAKVAAAVGNARAYLGLLERGEDFSEYLWRFVDGRTIQNHWRALGDIPSETAESRSMSKALRQEGFRFVGPTICYAFMQAVGMVNDHLVNCYRYERLRHG